MQGSHFSIGDPNRRIGMTVNQSTYRPLTHSAANEGKDAEAKIKSNHFELGGNALPGQYKSVTQSAFDFKGNANEIRSKLDTDRMNDLTASHFEVGGGDRTRMKSTMQASYMNNGPSNSAFNEDKKRDLRNSHFVLGEPATTDYKTNHEIQFRPHAFKGYE